MHVFYCIHKLLPGRENDVPVHIHVHVHVHVHCTYNLCTHLYMYILNWMYMCDQSCGMHHVYFCMNKYDEVFMYTCTCTSTCTCAL